MSNSRPTGWIRPARGPDLACGAIRRQRGNGSRCPGRAHLSPVGCPPRCIHRRQRVCEGWQCLPAAAAHRPLGHPLVSVPQDPAAPAAQVGPNAMAIRPALQMAGGGRGAERRYVILHARCAGRPSDHPPFPAVARASKDVRWGRSKASCHHLHAHLTLAIQFHPPGLPHMQDEPPAYCHTPDGPSKWEGQGSPLPQKQAGTPLSTLPEPSSGGFPHAARFLLGSNARPGHRMSVPWEIKGWARHLPTSRASRSPCHHLGTSA